MMMRTHDMVKLYGPSIPSRIILTCRKPGPFAGRDCCECSVKATPSDSRVWVIHGPRWLQISVFGEGVVALHGDEPEAERCGEIGPPAG
jgi:hypothetical protein